jgi:hypothetical protein
MDGGEPPDTVLDGVDCCEDLRFLGFFFFFVVGIFVLGVVVNSGGMTTDVFRRFGWTRSASKYRAAAQ